MTYNSNLQLDSMEALPEMYHIYNDKTNEYFTSWEEDVTFEGQTYTAAPIKRSTFYKDIRFSPIKITVKIPIEFSSIVYDYIDTPTVMPVTVVLYQAIATDLSDYAILIQGSVRNVVMEGKVAELEVEQHSTFLNSQIPQVFFQSYCNHDIYDDNCGVNEADFEVEGIITAIDGDEYTADVFGDYAIGYFDFGRAFSKDEVRLIEKHTLDVITLQIPFSPDVVVGDRILVYPGCDGSPATCKNTFDNFDNFLGMPYMPNRNPVLFPIVTST